MTHVSFDEAHMSSSIQSTPPMGTALQQAGYRKASFTKGKAVQIDPKKLKVKLLSTRAQRPVKGSEQAAGYDIFSAEDTIV